MIVMDPKRLRADIDRVDAWLKTYTGYFTTPGVANAIEQLVGAARVYLDLIPKPVEPQWRVILWRADPDMEVKEVLNIPKLEDALEKMRVAMQEGYARVELERRSLEPHHKQSVIDYWRAAASTHLRDA